MTLGQIPIQTLQRSLLLRTAQTARMLNPAAPAISAFAHLVASVSTDAAGPSRSPTHINTHSHPHTPAVFLGARWQTHGQTCTSASRTRTNTNINARTATSTSASKHTLSIGQDQDKAKELLVDRPHPSFITTLTLNRPKQANALGTNLMHEFKQALEDLESTPTSNSISSPQTHTRCVILTSSNAKVFCAGADLKERQQIKCLAQVQDLVTGLRTCFHRFHCLPVPTIAVVEGAAVGGGLELALAADVIVCSETATFGLPETSLGIIPGAGGTQRLPRRIGMARALELIATGRRIDAATALSYGLVQHVVPPGKAYDKAMELAQQIAKNAPLAVRAAKEAVQRGMEEPMSLEDALDIEKECYASTLPTRDRLEGLAAFKEGREPQYKGE